MSKELINSHYYIVSPLVILAATGIFFLQYERQKPTVKDFVTLAVLSAVAVVSRAAFAMVPHFKPITGIIMICGIAFGSGAGFLSESSVHLSAISSSDRDHGHHGRCLLME